jgi:hypothetical protein
MIQLFSNSECANRLSIYRINPDIINKKVNATLKALLRKRVYKTKTSAVEKRILTSARIQLYVGKLVRMIPAKELINMTIIPPNKKIFFIQLLLFT